MHIDLPNGDRLVTDGEFLKLAGGVTYRTGLNWDNKGCPHLRIGNRKYRPLNEALAWLASQIKRRNPSRRRSSMPRPPAPITLPAPDTS